MSLESYKQPEEEMYSELKSGVLSETISLEDLQLRLIKLDQSTPDRRYSVHNLELLKDQEVISFLEKQPEVIQKKYYNFLSFTEFHVGQVEACDFKDQEQALKHFKQALIAFEQGEVDADYRQEWGTYIKGTIAYLENDVESLTKYQSLIADKQNGKVLLRLKEGLEKRGTPNYSTDY